MEVEKECQHFEFNCLEVPEKAQGMTVHQNLKCVLCY
jgi:hypothetical protein